MRLRYLELDFFEQESRAATLKCNRSILHTCALRLPEIPLQLHDAAPIPELIHQLAEKPLNQVTSGPEAEPRIRDKLLRSLLPFKQARDDENAQLFQVSDEFTPLPLQEDDPRRIPLPELEPVQIFEEAELPLPQIWDSAGFHQNLDQPIIEILGSMREKLQQILIPCKLDYVEISPRKLAEQLTKTPQVPSLEEPVIIPELQPEPEMKLDPGKLAELLGVQPGDMQAPESLSLSMSAENLREDEDFRDFLSDAFLQKEEVVHFPEIGVAEALERSEEKTLECFEMEPVMVTEEARTLLWDPGSLAGALEVKPVEIEWLEASTGAEQLLEKLLVAPELSLGCNFFKFLSVPGVGEWSQKPERVAELVIGVLLSNTRSSQPSATDFIYLDWHYSQGNSCNDQRCFQLRNRCFCEAPGRIESEGLKPVDGAPVVASEQVSARVSGSGAFVSLEILPGDREASSGRAAANAGDVDRRKSLSGSGGDDHRRQGGFSRMGVKPGDAFLQADDHRRQENGFLRSGMELDDCLPQAGVHRRQEGGLPCSGEKLADAFQQAGDNRRQDNAFFRLGMELNDGLPEAGEAGGLVRSGVKLADAFPQTGDRRRQDNVFFRSGVELEDGLPEEAGHRRDEGGLPRSRVKLAEAFPKANDFLRSELELNDALPKADDRRRSGVKLADVLPKADETHQRQDKAFLRSEADIHRRQENGPGSRVERADDRYDAFLDSGSKLAEPLDDRQLPANAAHGHLHQQAVHQANAPPPSTTTCTAIFVANISLVNKQGLTSRRSSYQRVLSFEKNGAQVIERELRLPIDLILNPKECLVFYTAERLGLLGQAWDSEAINSCIVSIIDNEMKAISFGFQVCFMVFEGDRRFISAVLEDLDTIYVAAVGLNIHAQCFVASSPGETDEVVSRCLKQAQRSNSEPLPRMPESQTVAEAFLTQSPAINPLTAHAIISSVKPLSSFIAMGTPEQLQSCRPFGVSERSLELFKAQCEYGRVWRRHQTKKQAPQRQESHLVELSSRESSEKRAFAGAARASLQKRAFAEEIRPSSQKRAFAGARQEEPSSQNRAFSGAARQEVHLEPTSLKRAFAGAARQEIHLEPSSQKRAFAGARQEEIHPEPSSQQRAFAGSSLKRREPRQQTFEDVLPTQSTSNSKRVYFPGHLNFEEIQGPVIPQSQQQQQHGGREEVFQEKLELELSGPYFPPAAELNEQWSPEMNLAAPYFPPAAQLDEVWDESPTVGEAEQGEFLSEFDYENINNNKENVNITNVDENNTCEFGFSSNRRQSSSSSSVQDALRSWLSTREKNKQKQPATKQTRTRQEPEEQQAQAYNFPGRKREAPDGGNKASKKKQQQQKNDILSLWENFKCRKQAQIQASGSLLQTSKSFKRPASSIFSSSSSSPPPNPPSRQMQSLSSVAQQMPRGGKRAKRSTL